MIKASPSVEGEIVLSGDFAGTASVPALINVGITSGTYNLSKYLTCDKKGRVISIGAYTQTEIDAFIDAAYAASPSLFTIVAGRPVLNLPDAATTSTLGTVQLGANTGTTGTIPFTLATTSTLGMAKIGNGLENMAAADTVPGTLSDITLHSSFVDPTFYPNGTGYPAGFSSLIKNWNALIYVGGGSKAFYSTDNGVTWTSVTTPISSAYGICAGGPLDSYWNERITLISFASPRSASAMRSTNNGTTWTALTMPGSSTPKWSSCAWNGTTFCAVGSNTTPDALCATSPDGITWTTRTIGSFTPVNIITSGTSFYTAGYYSTGSTVRVYRSTDNGVNWTLQSEFANADIVPSLSVIGSNIILTECGTGTSLGVGYALISSDSGVTWTSTYIGSSLAKFYTSFAGGVYNVSADSYGTLIKYSLDGTTWKNKRLPITTGEQFTFDGSNMVIIGSSTAGAAKKYVISTTDIEDPTIIRSIGLNVDSSGFLPLTGGIVNKVFNPVISAPVAKTVFNSSNLANIVLTNANQVNISLAATYTPRRSVCASNGSMLCKFYEDLSGNWFSALSYDGQSWATYKVASPPANPAYTDYGMASDGGSRFVVYGGGIFGVQWTGTSTDGITWTYNADPWPSGVTAYPLHITSGLTYGFGKFVATGYDDSSGTMKFCSVWSTDGSTWTKVITTTTCKAMDAIGYSDGVASSTTAFMLSVPFTTTSQAMFYSLDGTTWTSLAAPTSYGYGQAFTANSSGIYFTHKISSTEIVPYKATYTGGALSLVASVANTNVSPQSTAMVSMYVTDDNYLIINQGSNSWKHTFGGSYVDLTGTYSTTSSHPIKLGGDFVFCENSSPILGSGLPFYGGTSPAVSITSTGGNNVIANSTLTTFTSYPSVSHELSIQLPNTSLNNVIGTIFSINLKNSVASPSGDNIVYELDFKKNPYTKVFNNNARLFLPTSTYKTYVALHTSSTEWLVFEE